MRDSVKQALLGIIDNDGRIRFSAVPFDAKEVIALGEIPLQRALAAGLKSPIATNSRIRVRAFLHAEGHASQHRLNGLEAAAWRKYLESDPAAIPQGSTGAARALLGFLLRRGVFDGEGGLE